MLTTKHNLMGDCKDSKFLIFTKNVVERSSPLFPQVVCEFSENRFLQFWLRECKFAGKKSTMAPLVLTSEHSQQINNDIHRQDMAGVITEI